MTEAEIRTLLANNIKQFDPTLTVIEEEFTVQMEDGTTGYIDILAKDPYGCLTIIELKKSKNSERSAIQQLFKYSAMLKDDFNVTQDKIRRVIISTDWRELMTPFAELTKHAKYKMEGIKLFIEGSSLKFEVMRPTSREIDINPTQKFHLFKFSTQQERDIAIQQFADISTEISELNLLVFKIDLNKPRSESVCFHDEFGYGLIVLSFFCDYASVLRKLSIAPEEYTPYGSIYDQKLLVLLALKVKFNEAFKSPFDYELERLHTLNNLAGWYELDENYIAFGKMFNQTLMSKAEVIDLVNGFTGLHPYLFYGRTSPKRENLFSSFRLNINHFLRNNLGWKVVVNQLLNEVEQDDDITINIFNPLNIIALLQDVNEDKEEKRVPQLHIEIVKPTGEIKRYFGTIIYDGNLIDSGIEEAINKTYGSLATFKKRTVSHDNPDKDEILSSFLGLKHSVMLQNENKILELDDGKLVQKEIVLDKINFSNFILDNIKLMDELGDFYEMHNLGQGYYQISTEDF